MVIKLAKDGHPPSMIGIILRDRYAIPLVKSITGKKIAEILKDADLAPTMPEDLGNLMEKAARLNAHLEKNHKDVHNKRALQIVEAKIHKLSKYYKQKSVLPKNWKYRT